jgi:hypothetical protein
MFLLKCCSYLFHCRCLPCCASSVETKKSATTIIPLASSKGDELEQNKKILSACKTNLTQLLAYFNHNEAIADTDTRANKLASLKVELANLDTIKTFVDNVEIEAKDGSKSATDISIGEKKMFAAAFNNFCDNDLFNNGKANCSALKKLIANHEISADDSLLCKERLMEGPQLSLTAISLLS